ncbi:16S rRNA (adenine(1518)-N(6)/adenine(1519)-N(6))-dimethyltransferase [Candidatus Saccharibacteria bacterium]|nr:16S rRNA (adenine(1518)-N(6)/adenine(1519)-N(6))-dimethyltransferase [Candidatus Saccharibacteria bacterium]
MRKSSISLPLAKKSLGQHWLTDTATLEAICNAANVIIGDTVLEIGPGTGTLTEKLLARQASVIAVEKDEKLSADLLDLHKAPPSPDQLISSGSGLPSFDVAKATSPSVKPLSTRADLPWERAILRKSSLSSNSVHGLKVINEDILKFDLTNLPASYKVVANIPYYLTSNLLRMLCESPNSPDKIVLLVQKEVAQRVASKPGNMSLLSVSVQFYYEAKLGQVVPAKFFTPPPKIDSQILILDYRTKPLFPDVDMKKFFQLVKAGFVARRKTLLNSLSGGLRIDKSEVILFLQPTGISPNIRPQELSLEDWHALYVAWQKS